MKSECRVRANVGKTACTDRRIFVFETVMKDAEALTRKLFENQTLFVPQTDDAAYKLKAELQQANARLVVISYLENNNALAEQREIFTRMLSRLPDPTVTHRIVYTTEETTQLSVLSELTAVDHVLVCGVDLKQGDESAVRNKNFYRDRMQILAVDRITDIDADPALKKQMWSEWMKQFSK
jgi:hypothetical protein